MDISTNPFFSKMKTEPGFEEQYINDVLSSVTKELEKSYEKDIKTGAKVIKLF